MKDPLVLIVKNFLDSKLVPGKPLLLGYSGGPDSKALLYLLLQCRHFYPIDLHVAHVNHGWRPESREEAEILQGEAASLGLSWNGSKAARLQ